MIAPKIWRFRNNTFRENIIRKLADKLGFKNFSKLVDIILHLADERLEFKDQTRRDIQKDITDFRFIPEDFKWIDK